MVLWCFWRAFFALNICHYASTWFACRLKPALHSLALFLYASFARLGIDHRWWLLFFVCFPIDLACDCRCSLVSRWLLFIYNARGSNCTILMLFIDVHNRRITLQMWAWTPLTWSIHAVESHVMLGFGEFLRRTKTTTSTKCPLLLLRLLRTILTASTAPWNGYHAK